MKTAANNVISFPNCFNRGNLPTSCAEAESSSSLMKQFYVQEVVDFVVEMAYRQFSIAGFNFDFGDRAQQRECSLIAESVRGALLRHYGVKHPFQKLSQKIFAEEDDGALSIVDRLSIKLKDKSNE